MTPEKERIPEEAAAPTEAPPKPSDAASTVVPPMQIGTLKRQYSSWEFCLIEAKKSRSKVTMHLDTVTAFTDNDGMCVVEIKYVEEDFIYVSVVSDDAVYTPWVGKRHIVSTEVLRSEK
jgi:hypothetical protein